MNEENTDSYIFNESFVRNKGNKLGLFFQLFKKVSRKFFSRFILCVALSFVYVAVSINFHSNLKVLFFNPPKDVEKKIDNVFSNERLGNDEKVREVKNIIEIEKGGLKKISTSVDKIDRLIANKEDNSKIFDAISEIKKELQGPSIWDKKDFSFKFKIFGIHLIKEEGLSILGYTFRLLFLTLVVRSIVSIVHYYVVAYCYDSLMQEIKSDLFNIFIKSKYSVSGPLVNKMISNITGDLDFIAETLWMFIPRCLMSLVTFLDLVFFDDDFSGDLSSKFYLIPLGLLFATGLIMFQLFRKATQLNKKSIRNIQKDDSCIMESFANLEYIKAASGEQYEISKVNKSLSNTFQKNKKALIWSVLFKTVPSWVALGNVSNLSLLFLLFFRGSEQYLPWISVVNFCETTRRLVRETEKMVEYFSDLDDMMAGVDVIRENLNILYQGSENIKKTPIPYINGDIVFEGVTFAYPNRPAFNILDNITFVFEQGQSYGISGSNGIGKSTITKALLKLLTIKSGSISISGVDIKNFDTVDFHHHICYQTNRPAIFSISIAQNVYYPFSCPANYKEELTLIAEKVGLTEFITSLPKGFDTKLRLSGANLSEGQKQQIAMMRAFVREYQIFILDELMSNVAHELRHWILRNVFNHIKGKTVLVIDHHISTFKYVDQVYIFNRNALIEKVKDED